MQAFFEKSSHGRSDSQASSNDSQRIIKNSQSSSNDTKGFTKNT